jgi:Ran GTPase-activating protein (RanGAP) involved in mRNA processing and transport
MKAAALAEETRRQQQQQQAAVAPPPVPVVAAPAPVAIAPPSGGLLTIQNALKQVEAGWKSQRIKLSGQTLTSHDFNQLKRIAIENKNVKSLEFCFCRVEESDFIQLMGVLKDAHLIGLQAARIDMTADGAAAVATLVQESQIKKIDVTYNNIGDEGGLRIVEALKDCGVECLLLARNNLTHKSFERLGNILQTTPTTLKTLDVSRNMMRDEGAIALAEGLPHTGLQCLLLDMNRITEAGIIALCDAVVKTESLTELSLSGNIVKSPKSMKAMIRMLANSNLEHFQLNYSDMDTESMEALANGVKESLHLKIFEVKENRKVDDTIIRNFLTVVAGHRSLQTLNLDDTEVTAEYEKEVIDHFNRMHNPRAKAMTIIVTAKLVPRIGGKSILQTVSIDIFRLLADYL